MSTFHISGPHRACESVLGDVGHGHGLVFGGERVEGHDGPEDFLGGRARSWTQTCQDGRTKEGPFGGNAVHGIHVAGSPGKEHPAFFQTEMNVGFHLGLVVLRNHRPHDGGFLLRVADLNGFNSRHELLGERFVNRGVDENT